MVPLCRLPAPAHPAAHTRPPAAPTRCAYPLRMLDRPEYHAPSRAYLSFTPPQPPAAVPSYRNESASRTKNDKYQAGRAVLTYYTRMTSTRWPLLKYSR